MQDILSMMRTLRRPRLLIRAARIGANDYNRDKHLQRLLGYGTLPRSGPAMLALMDLERRMNDQRKGNDTAYSLVGHLDVLIAMIGESRILRDSQGSVT